MLPTPAAPASADPLDVLACEVEKLYVLAELMADGLTDADQAPVLAAIMSDIVTDRIRPLLTEPQRIALRRFVKSNAKKGGR